MLSFSEEIIKTEEKIKIAPIIPKIVGNSLKNRKANKEIIGNLIKSIGARKEASAREYAFVIQTIKPTFNNPWKNSNIYSSIDGEFQKK